MIDKQNLLFKYTGSILDIINNRDNFNTSDLQGAVEPQITMLINNLKNDFITELERLKSISEDTYTKEEIIFLINTIDN